MAFLNSLNNRVLIGAKLALIFCLISSCSNFSFAQDARQNIFLEADQKLATDIEQMLKQEHLPGMVLAVMHKNQLKIHSAFGFSDIENQVPMQKDNIFRLYSMTKPITALATLKLLAEKDIPLDTPLQQFYPKFTRQSAIPIDTLLTHTSGLSYGFKINRIAGWKYLFSGIGNSASLTEFMDVLAELPLMSEPRVRWRYSFSSDVQGALIETLSESRLQEYFTQSILTPLHMTNTGFYVSESELPKVVPMYSNSWFSDLPSKQSFEQELTDAKAVQSGGSGLLSTAADYMKFLQVLMYPTHYQHIIEPLWVEKMLTNQIAEDIQGVPERLYSNSGFGYGLGVKLVDERYLSQGSVYWAGKGGTVFWIDRKQDLAVVAMMQMEGGNRELEKKLLPMVYEWLNKK
jgi:CubicO group peptidase (beta-lactamase class C family)